MLNYENGNCKYAIITIETYYFIVKVETASMLNYENRNSKYA